MNKTYLEPTRQPKPRLSVANSLPASIFDYKKLNYAKVRADKNRQLGFNSVQNVNEKSPSKQLHITYLHTDPDLHPRTRKIKDTFEKYGFKFVVFKPRFRVNLKNRILSAGINYFLFFWETLYIPGDILWVA